MFNSLLFSVMAQDFDGAGAAGAAAGGIGGLIGLIIGIIAIAAMWKVFTKADKPGWAAIIPIYNLIVLLEIVNRPIWWIILYLIPFVNFIVAIILLNDLSKAFGKGVGFTVGLILLSPIFLLILGFGDATYQKPKRAA